MNNSGEQELPPIVVWRAIDGGWRSSNSGLFTDSSWRLTNGGPEVNRTVH